VLESPFVGNAQFDALMRQFNAPMVEIDCTFPADGGDSALRDGLARIRAEAEDAVRSGAGHIVLTDSIRNETRCRCR
jgi:glutamate synthase (NADPH/NADH) large chain